MCSESEDHAYYFKELQYRLNKTALGLGMVVPIIPVLVEVEGLRIDYLKAIPSVSVRVFIVVIKHSSSRRKGLFHLEFYIAVCHWRKSGQEYKERRNLEARIKAESMVKAAYYTNIYILLSIACSSANLIIQPRTSSSRNGTLHSGLKPPRSNINQENVAEMCPQTNLVGHFFQLRSPLPRSP